MNPDELSCKHSTVGTKFIKKWSEKICDMALEAVRTVYKNDNGHVEIDIKRYAKVEKVCCCTQW
jgi:T-complex protein 1 subunit gamma